MRKPIAVSLLAAFVAVALSASPLKAQVSFGAFPNNGTHSSAAVAEAIANVPAALFNSAPVHDADGQTNDIYIYNFGNFVYEGPVDVSSTLQRIFDGDWMPTEIDDGGFFNFAANELPNIPRMGNDYYMEFVVWPLLDLTDGTYDTTDEAYGSMAYPGAMRLLIGLGGQVYFTGDHYGESGPQADAYYVNPVPEPSMLILAACGALGVILVRRRKRN